MRQSVRLTILLSGVLAATVPGTTVGQSPGQASPFPAALPSSIVVIGHSGATGYDSDPQAPGTDNEANSWATGTNPDVASVYLRVLARNPSVAGNVQNFAIDGSAILSLTEQARQAVAVTPTPDLVLVQSIDNDIHCDGTDDANYEPYRAHLTEVLDTLTTGLPNAEIFFVSQWADVATYDRAAVPLRSQQFTGGGPCDVVDPTTTQIDPAREAYLQGLVDHYFGIITETCAKYPTCRTDGGALQHMDLAPEDLSPDLNHLSVSGHARMAAITFEALYGPSATIEAKDLSLTPRAISLPASHGATIVLRNDGRLVHNLTIDALGIQVVASPGTTAEVIVPPIPPGTYTFYCSVSGHREAGMEGTLTVP
jgi:plastocyanin